MFRRCLTRRPVLVRHIGGLGRRTDPSFIELHLAQPFNSALETSKAAAKISLVAFLGLGFVAATAYQGLHVWAEMFGMSVADADEETKRWQWDEEADKWTGHGGGTNPELGFIARHYIRLAWLSSKWVNRDDYFVVGGAEPSDMKILPADLVHTQRFLQSAISIAEKKHRKGKLSADPLVDLLMLRAGMLERINDPDFWAQAIAQYESAWSVLQGTGFTAARVALKLGDLNQRVGRHDVSMSWWLRALHLCDESSGTEAPTPNVPVQIPSSPLRQRILASILVSISRHYAATNRLPEALAIEKSAVSLLNSLTSATPPSSSSPSQELHRLTLLERAAVLTIHQAEVLYQMKKSGPPSPLKTLSLATSTAETCVAGLISGPDSEGDLKDLVSSEIPRAEYLTPFLHGPASNLLHRSRRAAATAWNLMGMLYEQEKRPDPVSAVACYDRAVRWSGVITDEEKLTGEPGPYTLALEWISMRDNLIRAKKAVESRQSAGTRTRFFSLW
ncbi:hypothetical protein C8J56DRAFT_955563 [Mycena floridula]|nr:hypothetical protein C8J56DRAFT_955563 [Mycena floridula]